MYPLNCPSARELEPQPLEIPLAPRAFGCNLNVNAVLQISWPEPPALCHATHCSRTMPPAPCPLPRTSGGHFTRRGVPSAAEALNGPPPPAPAPQPLCYLQKFLVPCVKVKYAAPGDAGVGALVPASPSGINDPDY